MSTQKLFGEYTLEELEKFESDTNGIVVFNSIGENAISLQVTDQADVLMYIDKIDNEDQAYPETFVLEPSEIARVYNLLAEIINNNPNTFKLRSSNDKQK